MPSQARKITFDTAALFTAKIISLLLGLVRLKYIATYLGVETFGIYTFAIYYVAMFSIFFEVGLGQILTRDIAADKSKTSEYVSNALFLKLLLLAGTTVIIGLATYFSHFDLVTNWAVAFSVLITGTTSLVNVFTGAFQAHRRMKLISLITVATDLLTSVAVIVLLVLGYGLFGLMLGSAIVSLIMFALSLYLSLKLINVSFRAPSTRTWKYLLKEGYPIAIGSLGVTLYLYVTSALLKYIDGNLTAGYYNAAFKIISILTAVPVSFGMVIYPFFAQLHVSEKEKLESVLNISVRYMYILSIPMAVGTILIAKKLLVTVYTESFLPSTPALQLLILSSMFNYGGYVIYMFFAAIKKQRFGMYATLITGVIVVIVNYILIPRFGLIVPAFSLALADFALVVAGYFYLRKLHYSLILTKIFLKPVLACIPMAAVIILTADLSLFIQIPAAIVAYALSFYFMKGILEEDRTILERILPSPLKGVLLKYTYPKGFRSVR